MTEMLTYAEAAERLSVSRATLYRMIADGIITPIDVPRRSRRGTIPRISSEDVQALLNQDAATTRKAL